MNPLLTALDLCLAAILIGLTWAVLFSRDDFRAVVLFISLGLLMALAWVRLSAPEVALAEAAIGAGISGALLLSALPRLRKRDNQTGPARKEKERRNRWLAPAGPGVLGLLGLATLLLLLTSGILLGLTPPFRTGPAPLTTELMPLSGVSNQVTAVLLNFRSFDTLLELAVLLLAVMGLWSWGRGGPAGPGGRTPIAAGPVLLTLIRGILPLAILIAGYLAWIGDRAPGGAFQSGAVLGAAGIMLGLTVRPLTDFFPTWLLRAVLVVGLGLFLLLAALPLAGGRLFFQYPPAYAGAFILAIEAAAALAIGLALSLLPGSRPR
ncbi:hydrogenase subunit MbhD domain-containing protein [Desulfurivibrio sp. D14AmB]|uniref:hydrogenase subunit MbhD domain-containing protein n=1 Tax=Desulfurivibrio sp. D14AmB TaxID=3374370 RepID=UPI00376F19C8